MNDPCHIFETLALYGFTALAAALLVVTCPIFG